MQGFECKYLTISDGVFLTITHFFSLNFMIMKRLSILYICMDLDSLAHSLKHTKYINFLFFTLLVPKNQQHLHHTAEQCLLGDTGNRFLEFTVGALVSAFRMKWLLRSFQKTTKITAYFSQMNEISLCIATLHYLMQGTSVGTYLSKL